MVKSYFMSFRGQKVGKEQLVREMVKGMREVGFEVKEMEGVKQEEEDLVDEMLKQE